MITNYYLIFILLILKCCYATLPSDIAPCKVGDDICISKTITDILRKNPNGKSDLGLPKLEPLKINNLIIDQGNQGALNFKLDMQNVELYGLSKATINKVVGFTEDPETSKFDLFLTLPELQLNGKYTVSGNILVLPINGNGDFEFGFENLKVSIKFKPTVTNQNGKLHLNVDKLKILLEPERLKIRLDNLFNGDKTLGEHMNTFLNENWKDIWVDLSPSINEAISQLFKDLIRNVFKKVTYDEFYQK